MTIRFEFVKSKSVNFLTALRICKKFSTYKTEEVEGVTIHSVEFDDSTLQECEAVWGMLYKWRGTIAYIDGRLASAWEVHDLLFKRRIAKMNNNPESSQKAEFKIGLNIDSWKAAEELVAENKDAHPEIKDALLKNLLKNNPVLKMDENSEK